MRTVFADTGYWVGLLNPRDRWHEQARSATQRLGIARLVTTDEVLSEVLAFFSGYGAAMRQSAARLVRQLLHDLRITVIPQTRISFLDGLTLYEERADNGYSLVDCVSMLAMKEQSLAEVLTNDHHFAQEGYLTLLEP